MDIDEELEKYGVWIKKGPMDSPREDIEPLDLIPVESTASDTIPDDVLKDVTFSVDTDWKLGLIGRNGKGKTTLLNLFMGRYEYQGSISASTCFDYFPYTVFDSDLTKNAVDLIERWKKRNARVSV